ncbi:MAG: cytochrome c biogenesis protein CcdA [bacterium]
MISKEDISKIIRLLIFLIPFALSIKLYAQTKFPSDVVESATLSLDKKSWGIGDTISGKISLTLAKGWHINSNAPDDPYQIPTLLSADSGIKMLTVFYPAPDMEVLLGDTMPVFKDSIVIAFSVTPDQNFNKEKSKINLEYQGCNDKTCLMPKTRSFVLPASSGKIEEKTLGQKLLELPFLLRLPFLFLLGLLLGFNPCVFPVIPITVTFFLNQGKARSARIVILGLLYVAGMALLFSGMGVIAALTGSFVSFLFQEPLFIIFIVLVLLAFALSMFGLFEIRLPAFLSRYGTAKQGYGGALLMGLFAGLFTLPCTSGPLMALVAITAASRSVIWGFAHFMFLGIGLGAPFFLLSIFSGKLSSLPKSGDWLLWVRKLFGFLVLGVALFFAHALLMRGLFEILLFLLIVCAAVYLGFIDKSGKNSRGFIIFRRLLGSLLLLFCIWYFGPLVSSMKYESVSKGLPENWNYYEQKLLESTLREKNIALLDFTADWCVKCKQLDRKTFSDSLVKEKLKGIGLFKVDFTVQDQNKMEISKKYSINALPVIVLIDSKGIAIKGSRIDGFIGPDQFLDHLSKFY